MLMIWRVLCVWVADGVFEGACGRFCTVFAPMLTFNTSFYVLLYLFGELERFLEFFL